VLQCGAVCCSVLQCVAVCWERAGVPRFSGNVMQCSAVFCSVLQFVGKGQGCPDFQAMLQCVAVCCSVLHCIAVCCSVLENGVGAQILRRRQYNVAACCSVWCSARCSVWCSVRCSVWCSVRCCNTLQHTATPFSLFSTSGQQNKATHTTTYCNTLKHTATHCNTQKASGKDAQ